MVKKKTAEQNELEAVRLLLIRRTRLAAGAIDLLDSVMDLTRKIRVLRGPNAETRDQRFMIEAEVELLYRVTETLVRIAERN